MHPQRQAIWGNIWKHTVEKSQTNATSVTLYLLGQTSWGHIWKRTVEKSQTNASNAWEKSKKCNHCDYASSRAANLRRHLKTHSGEKLNKCSQCDYASCDAGTLRRHLKTHNGEKQMKPMWLCLLCPKFRMMAICHLRQTPWGLIWKHNNPWYVVRIQWDEINIKIYHIYWSIPFFIGARSPGLIYVSGCQ